MSAVVEVRDLTARFATPERIVHAINGISFDLAPGEVLGILGESGSGKSVTLKALMRLLPPTCALAGRIAVCGQDMLAADAATLEAVRGPKIAMIFQEPMTALDPVFTIGEQIAETVRRHDGLGRAAAMARALELLELVQIPSAKRRLGAYPHEMSGGMRQRAMIALALSCRPSVLLADEPTTALDVTVQMQILLLLRQLQRELGMAVIFVTHDVGVAVEISDRMAVMYAGRFVEAGTARQVIRGHQHPYTAGLLRSTLHGVSRGTRLDAIPGAPPSLARIPAGCSFAPRCTLAEAGCRDGVPALRELSAGHAVACIKAVAPHEAAPQ